MASAIQGLRLSARTCQCRFATRSNTYKSIGRRRQFMTTSMRHEEEHPTEVKTTPSTPTASPISKASQEFVNKLDPNEKAIYDSLSDIEKKQYEADARTLEAHFTKPEVQQRLHNVVAHAQGELGREIEPFREPKLGKYRSGFFAQGEEASEEVGEDPEFREDDISSIAHGDLEQHRELREYARLAAWEMPLLAKMSKPFVPPTLNEPLRFRYTSYMGEQHPAEKKVVVEFCPADMPNLTDLQKDKLRKLAGVRWNPEKDIVKMSSEMFQSQAQNKRYLGDLVDTLLTEARDPKDTFEDVPLDTRHHTFKVKPKFPKEWRLSPERIAELAAFREQTAFKQQQALIEDKVVDGLQQISISHRESSLAAAKARAAMPELVPAGKAIKGGKKVGVRR